MTRQPSHIPDTLFWVLILTSQAVHNRLRNRTRTQLNPLVPLADGVKYSWLILVPKDDIHFEQEGLRPRAAEMIREVWVEDPDAELLVVEPLGLSELHARLDGYPRAKIDPTSDLRWCKQIQPDIRYGFGGLQ